MNKHGHITVSDLLSPDNFERIKNFILKKGFARTYCNMYNNNPYYQFADFNVFLTPSSGQQNINCDPALSDFNELVIQNFKDGVSIYYPIILSDATYLSTVYLENDRSIEEMKKNLETVYLKEILEKINS